MIKTYYLNKEKKCWQTEREFKNSKYWEKPA